MPVRPLLAAAVLLLSAPTAAQIPVELLYDARSPNQADGHFGRTLAPFPDVDADGVADLLVGAFYEDVGGVSQAGRGYLLSGATGAVLRTFDSPPGHEAHYGVALAIAGDRDDDGTPDVLVGANLFSGSGGTHEGRVYVVSSATGALLSTVQATGTQAKLGTTVVALGDLDGDGVPDLASGQVGLGSVVVASGATGEVFREVRVGGDATMRLGESLVGVSDLTGDGIGEIAVGSPRGGTGRGRVYVVDPATGGLVLTIVNPTGVASQEFGARRRLAAVGDLDGDGRTDLAVGSLARQANGMLGAVYLHSGADGALLRTCTEPGWQGRPLGPAGDLDGDGVPDVLSGGLVEGREGVVVLSGATCAVLVEIASPFGAESEFPTDLAAIREADDGEAWVAVGGMGRLPGEAEPSHRVRVYRVGGTVASAPSPAASGLAVSVSPLPSSRTASVTVDLASPASVRIAVVDALGRTLATLHDGPLGAGRHRLTLPPAPAPGIYAVRVSAGAVGGVARWVVAR